MLIFIQSFTNEEIKPLLIKIYNNLFNIEKKVNYATIITFKWIDQKDFFILFYFKNCVTMPKIIHLVKKKERKIYIKWCCLTIEYKIINLIIIHIQIIKLYQKFCYG